MHGSLTVILDDNERVKLNAGDVLIQRGTIHGWHNEGTEWARVFAVMLRKWSSLSSFPSFLEQFVADGFSFLFLFYKLAAEKVKIGDKVLE